MSEWGEPMESLVRLDTVGGEGDLWTMQGVLAGLSLLVGPSKSKKSFLAVDWAVHIAAGRMWYGHHVQKGAVVYIVGEGGVVNVARRAREAARHAKIDPDGLPLYFLPHSLPLSQPESLKALQEAIEALPERPSLIIVDTLSQCMPGDENKQEDMQRFVAAVNELKFRWGATVLVVHHTPISTKSRPRGSSVLIGAADTCFLVSTDKRFHPSAVVLSCDKLKDQETEGFEPEMLKAVAVSCRDATGELILDNWGDVVTTLVLEPPGEGLAESRATKAFGAFVVLSAARAEDVAVGWKEWYEATDMPKSTFKRAVADVLDDTAKYGIHKLSPGHYTRHPDKCKVLGINFETDHDEAMRREADELAGLEW